MFFTQEDFRKIQRWLIHNSVRDTELDESILPLDGSETVAIVKGKQNKRIFLKDLISQISTLEVPDFLNVTYRYKSSHISLEEAIRLIPYKARKIGQVITFINEEGVWQTYQFEGALNQWNIIDQWSLK